MFTLMIRYVTLERRRYFLASRNFWIRDPLKVTKPFLISRTLFSQHLTNRLLRHTDGLNLLVNIISDRILIIDFNQLKMPPKEDA
jgi:hypothetical protein